jgi:alcohol dehydrogenase class IV
MDPLRVYQYSNPGRLIFGPGASAELKKEISIKDKPLIVTDEGIARAGILKTVRDLLVEAGVDHEIFDRVKADPPIGVVEEAAVLYREKDCKAIIGLGGGSSMDAAKAVAVVGTHGGTLKEYLTGKPVEGMLPPLYAIPTTAGTGSEVTETVVISDVENKVKLAFKSPLVVARVALLDPLLLSSMPPKVAAETGADALTHAIESCMAPSSNAITEALALSAITMIVNNLPKFVASPQDVAAAGQMLLASCMAGLAFKNTMVGLTHALSHPVGAYFHIGHGLACALYLPAVMEFNVPVCAKKLALIADAAGVDVRGLSAERAASEAVHTVRRLFATVSLPKTFSEMGIEFKLQPKMVEDAFAQPPAKNNPRPADRDQIRTLFTLPEIIG